MAPAQGFVSSFAPRLRQYQNTLIAPVIQTAAVAPTSRTTKRGTTVINYADDAYDDDDFDDSEPGRRPTGLRSIRREDLEKKDLALDKIGKEIDSPVDLQPIYRNWMLRRSVKPTTDQQVHIQAQLPLTLIPIRIDVDVPSYTPDAPFPLPARAVELGLNPSLPAFRRPEPAPPYKIRDVFLWNLHEALLTPDDFALSVVQELDLPNQTGLALSISSQIRQQLEEYAGVALHPLFHNQAKTQKAVKQSVIQNGTANQEQSPDSTPRPSNAHPSPRHPSITSVPSPPLPFPMSRQLSQQLPNGASVTAVASPMPAEPESEEPQTRDPTEYLNPDDTYRCIIILSISLASRLYSDKFEWSLLHPPGLAEIFAKQTCADMGLGGEWVLAIATAIYEAVLRLKKEACEGGMLMTGGGVWGQGDVDNQAVRAEEGAGWRYDADDFGAEWEPKVELLSTEEIEKREGDRERQLRRLRRETARFSSNTGMMPSAREQEAQMRGSYFETPNAFNMGGDETPNLGRGERSKKKRRFRSLSPVAKAQTPAEGVNGIGSAWGGADNKLADWEKQTWRCKWCLVWGSAVWAVRDGPTGPRTLCNNCGLLYERDKVLPVWSKELHKHDVPIGR